MTSVKQRECCFEVNRIFVIGLMGVGRMWSPKTGWGNACDVLLENGLEPIQYKPKEVIAN